MSTRRELHQIIHPLLEPQEVLIWSGKSRRSWLSLTPSDLFILPFMAIWCWHAFTWEWMAIHFLLQGEASHTPLPLAMIMVVFGLPFVGVGLWLLYNRFVKTPWTLMHTLYGLTNQNLIIATQGKPNVRRIPLSQIRLVLIDPSPGEVFQAFGSIAKQYRGQCVSQLTDAQISDLLSGITRHRSVGTVRILLFGNPTESIALYDLPQPDHVVSLIRSTIQEQVQQPAQKASA